MGINFSIRDFKFDEKDTKSIEFRQTLFTTYFKIVFKDKINKGDRKK